MKKLSETLTELGIDCAFPIEIMEANDRVTYFEDCDGYWERYERDSKGRPIYHEDSNGFWQRWVRDANGDVDYYEDSTGVKKGTPQSASTCDMIDKRTEKQIKRLFAVVTDDSLMNADFEYVKSAITCVRNECNRTEAYMREMDKIVREMDE